MTLFVLFMQIFSLLNRVLAIFLNKIVQDKKARKDNHCKVYPIPRILSASNKYFKGRNGTKNLH